MEIIPVINISIWLIVKIMVLIALLVYTAFATVVYRQTKIMTETLEIGLEWLIQMVAIGHLLFSIGTFILALVIL